MNFKEAFGGIVLPNEAYAVLPTLVLFLINQSKKKKNVQALASTV